MYKVWLIIFTSLPPHVQPELTEIVVPSMEQCAATIARTADEFNSVEGLVYTMRCEKRLVKERDDV